ncbi:MAG: hypothetical protein MUF84_11835 [Anaerolineae bacterium]|jgi:hypothetical protein|nr:hypothetical protein [Anaerolineae bacterium]
MTVRTASLFLLKGVAFVALLCIPLSGWTVLAAPLEQADGLEAILDVAPTPTVSHIVFLPLIERHTWVPMSIRNGGFEEAWETESSHQALKVNTDEGSVTTVAIDNILTPPGWLTWFREGAAYEELGQDGGLEVISWRQPEVKSVNHHNPDRMNSGLRGQLLFTVWRVHDAGFLQHVDVSPGQPVRLSGWAHAWSNNEGAPTPDNPDDPYWSEGSQVGFNHFSALEGAEGLDGGDQNFTFMLGIDPTGGNNPFADTVVWGSGMHVYNGFREVPAVTATAQGTSITIFLRSRTLWRYKHNDAYWDDITLQVAQ